MGRTKISEMVLDFAGDYIRLGGTPEERQNYLKAACTAWNIACAPEKERTGLLDQFLHKYCKWNPDKDAENVHETRQDMEQLIQQKIEKYPNVNRQIVDGKLRVVDGQDHITILSLQPDQ